MDDGRDEYRRKAEYAQERAEQARSSAMREAWLRVARSWRVLLDDCDCADEGG